MYKFPVLFEIYELDPDLLHNLTTENRRQMFLGMIEEPITTDIRRYIIARLETGLDAQPPLLRIQEMVERNVPGYEDPEGTLLRTVNYALERIRARQDSNPRSPA